MATPVPAPNLEPLVFGERHVTSQWLQYFNTIEDTLELSRDPISDSGGIVTPRWTEYFRGISTTSAPAPVESRIEQDGYITQPWIEFLLDVTG